MARASLADEIAAVRAICHRLELGDVTPVVLKEAHHTTLLVPPLRMVARVQSSGEPDIALQRAIRELAVTRHLVSRSAPVLAPAEETLAGPHVIGPSIMSLWPHVEHARIADEADAPLAAAALASVHRALHDYAGALPPYTQTLDRCWTMLADGGALAALSRADRDLLGIHYRRLRHEVEAAAGIPVPLHGDAHLGNCLLSQNAALWTDFEDACLGPREIDIAGLPPAIWPYFDEADQTLIRRCADLKSVCVAIWCWADVSRSPEIREAAGYHLHRVRNLTL